MTRGEDPDFSLAMGNGVSFGWSCNFWEWPLSGPVNKHRLWLRSYAPCAGPLVQVGSGEKRCGIPVEFPGVFSGLRRSGTPPGSLVLLRLD